MTSHDFSERWVLALLAVVLAVSVGLMVSIAADWARLVGRASSPPPVFGLAKIAILLVALTVFASIATAASRAPNLLARNTRLAALVYAWGGLAMFGMYEHAGLHWQHGWQYGAAMCIVAIGLALFSRRLTAPDPRLSRLAVWLTLAHGLAAAAAIIFLFASGKVWAPKADWAANVVFIAGALAVIGVCAATLWGRARTRA